MWSSACARSETSHGTERSVAPSIEAAPLDTAPEREELQKPWFMGSFHGRYEVELHRIERAALQASWLRDDGTELTGAGNVRFEVDDRGQLQGSAEGALGSQRVVGAFFGDRATLSFNAEPATLSGFSGIAECKRREATAVLDCTLAQSSGDGNIVRKGTLHLSRPDAR